DDCAYKTLFMHSCQASSTECVHKLRPWCPYHRRTTSSGQTDHYGPSGDSSASLGIMPRFELGQPRIALPDDLASRYGFGTGRSEQPTSLALHAANAPFMVF